MKSKHSTRKWSTASMFILLGLLVFALPASAAWNDTYKGYATYTGSGYSGGAVLLDPIPANAKITALNPTQMNYGGVKAALAGAYLEVQGPLGKTTVYVTDLYPEGANGALDLSPNAFAAIGDMSKGKIDIQWKVVKTPITGNFSYRIKEGSSQWWAAIQVRNHKYPVMKFEYEKAGQWISLPKTDYNHFVGEKMGNQPLKVRITDIRGKVVTDILQPLPSEATSSPYIVAGNVQFPD
ncbi:expansin (peptidoglycan-binding protein) [Paenibacillus sp. SORGH_AS306]|uniref:expansin EXLX1 family cellulose-binding protein n=1 Tax=unclassified Paenibacillus TaxID=185978 RepID=UPI002783F257|nr:expansin (peptidoglycan-binding protein) [Paenibacillus sp. SORGH_AS_0306]MDR6109864.1 expansin (peptidoglycan-binding protein) [Paenibacillus sp. SORGH_AS_0338]